MKKKSLCILTLMVLGIILASGVTINIAKEQYKEQLLNQKKASMEKALENLSNKKEEEKEEEKVQEEVAVENNDRVDEADIIESNGSEIKENVEKIDDMQSDEEEISVDNNYDIKTEESINLNEPNNETVNSSNNSNQDSKEEEDINIEKPEELEIDYSTNIGAPDAELVMSYDYLRVYLEKDYISVYKNITGAWEFHAGADILQNPPYSWKAINSIYMFTDSRIPDDRSYDLNIVTYDHPDRLRTESYVEVMLNGEILYTQDI